MGRKPANYWVLRGARTVAARDKYLDYLRGLIDVGKEEGTASANRPPRVPLYLEPWAFPLATDYVETESAEQPAWDLLKAIAPINTRVTDAIGANTPVKITSYRAPRLVRVALDGNGTTAKSKRTGLSYTKYNHESRSVPFGKKAGDTTISQAFAEMVAALQSPTVAVRLIDERY